MEGQEAVWEKLWKEYGLTDIQLKEAFTGPAFLPWQRMGLINGHQGPLPREYIDKKANLQKKILQKMKTLGMHPVVPAFNGYVPKTFANNHPDLKINELNSWSGGGFESTYLLDPKEPLFKEIGKRFIEIYTELYGESRFYLADSFNEIRPPTSEENKNEELSEYGSMLYETIDEAAPGATWVLQGWLFGHDKKFWNKSATKAFLSKVPNDKMIIQDFGNDRFKVWENQEAFYGKQWIYSYVHNYGGANPVYGDLDFYHDEINTILSHEKRGNLKGYGIMPEGLNNSSLVYEYIYDLAWTQGKESVNDWLKKYLKARYGEEPSSNVLQSWKLLKESVYSTKYWTSRWWDGRAGSYLFLKRPTHKITEFTGHPSNKEKLKKALVLLTSESKKGNKKSLYSYDVINFSRHYNALHLDSLLIACVKAYKLKNIQKGDALYVEIEKLSSDLDSLISKQPINDLNFWLSSAWNYGDSISESELYLKNAKTIITIWGGNGNLNDYASKSWHGMYNEFYWPRWKMFLHALRKSAVTNKPFDELEVRKLIKELELKWCNDDKM